MRLTIVTVHNGTTYDHFAIGAGKTKRGNYTCKRTKECQIDRSISVMAYKTFIEVLDFVFCIYGQSER